MTHLYAAYKRLTSKEKTGNRLKVKEWEKKFHANRSKKEAGLAILISDKIDFKTKM